MIKRLHLIVFFILSITLFSRAQTYQWSAIPNAPSNNIKLDDIFFINPNTGWVVSGQGQSGIYKTTNSGINWTFLYSTDANFRAVGFADSLNGWTGELDRNRIFKTTNSGTTWNIYTLPSPNNVGTCGLYVVDKNIVFGCGQVAGPAYFYKTTNGGLNWSVQDMSSLALC